MKNWDVFNDYDIIEMLHYISSVHGDSCSRCPTKCCTNKSLQIDRNCIKLLAKRLRINPSEFRHKYTGLSGQLYKDAKWIRPESRIAQNVRILKFIQSSDTITMPGTTVTSDVSYCPFYNQGTHRCTIYDIRPNACRLYPFNWVDDEIIEVRNVTRCVVTDNFLKRFFEFLNIFYDTYKADAIALLIEYTKKTIESKEYQNRFNLMSLFILEYLKFEFNKMNDKQTASKLDTRIIAQQKTIMELKK